MPMSHKDLWVKIKRETKGKTPVEEASILRAYLAGWPEYKGPYQELGKKLTRRVEELERVLSVRASHEAHTDPFSIRKRGLAEVGLVGLPNVGKSTLFRALTGAPAEVADYPYTTLVPNVGMMAVGAYEFEIVDLPPLSEEPVSELSYAGGLREAVSNAGLLIIVVDLREDLELQLWLTDERLTELGTRVVWRADGPSGIGSGDRVRQSVLVGTHADRTEPSGAAGAVHGNDKCPEGGQGSETGGDVALRGEESRVGRLAELAPGALVFTHPLPDGGRALFGEALCGLVGRIVVKARDPEEPDEPLEYAVPRGATALDLAQAVHKELAGQARGARVWGPSARYEGQEVGLDHLLEPGDMVEIIER